MTTTAGRGATAAARVFVFVLAPASTIFATRAMGEVLAGAPAPLLAQGLLILFCLSFLWLSFAFWSGILGFVVTLLGLESPGLLTAKLFPRYAPTGRTAILMPVRNEDPARTIGSIEAMDEALARLGVTEHFHFFILSDTNKPGLWVEEELAWARLVARRGAGSRIFYRRRARNLSRKSGNIADFVERWGDGLRVRTYERGVEDETLACGTGLTASALAAALRWDLPSPVVLRAQSGLDLRVYFRRDGATFGDVQLEGEARFVFEGRYPVPDAWLAPAGAPSAVSSDS